ncbi:TetR/AcrR family transcriptional regulator [Paludisphaera borealis]|uniref:HTH-type transcriptional repressor AcnR n=1 Tax=Paludisphaera borealis TaxID=1387353 RepID=A0A1U7CPN5_9BACT|nr:TetR/AcrR family transcriptional regulator [Paludisphaera borealis]APW60866.1 HTH-type transcriptional repressor AcnR [Paludisphaera borealis]
MSSASEKKMKRCCSHEEVESRKEEILRTATELFAEHGFSDAITQALADRMQVGKGTIYRHFPSKRELFLAAVDRVMRKMRDQVMANIAGVDEGLEQMARGIMAFLTFFSEHPEYVEMLIQERAQFKDRTRPTYIEHRDVNVKRWKALYARLIAEGRIRDVPVERISDVVGNVIYGTMFTNYFAGQAKPVAEQARDILDVIFHGILTDSERSRRQPGDVLQRVLEGSITGRPSCDGSATKPAAVSAPLPPPESTATHTVNA